MKPSMNRTLIAQKPDTLDCFLVVLEQIIARLKDQKNIFVESITICRDLRRNRKEMALSLKEVLKKFDSYSEKQQVDFELHLFRTLNEYERIVPTLTEELNDEFILFRWFLTREVTNSFKIIKKAQRVLANKLYPDPTDKILSNPELQKRIAQAWGDLANDDY